MLALSWRRRRADVTALARSAAMLIGDMIVGSWIVGFHFLMLLPPRDDHSAGISANVDDVAEITVGVVEEVAPT